MGRQIAIAMDHEDEREFLAFLRATSDISIYRSWSPRAGPVSEFSEENSASPFYLHNAAFSWQPMFEVVNTSHRQSGASLSYHRVVSAGAPLLEYSRHPFGAASPQVGGRLYWQKDFLGRVTYDLGAFDSWFSSVTAWVRRNAVKVQHGSTEPWCLPGAKRALQR